MRFSLGFLLLLASAVPATANDWRAMRAEYAAEYENAKMMAGLDCAGLHAYVEQQRWLTYQRTSAEYHRTMSPGPMYVSPLPIPATSPAPAPVAFPPRPR